MKYQFQIATALNVAVAAALAGVGLDYVLSPGLKAHHLQILDVSFDSLTVRTQILLVALMKGTGLVAIQGAVGLALLLLVPFRRRENWSRWAILAIGGLTLIPTLFGALRLRAQTGAAAEWWPHVVMLSALLLAFGLARDFRNVELTN